MLLNPENFEYSRYNQKRSDGNKYGESGPLYLAKDCDGIKLIVKQMNAMDAANEYLASSIARLLGINTPTAWLFSSHKQIKRISFRHSVGIEFFEDFILATKEDLIQLPNEAARCIILNLLVNQEDGMSFGVHGNRIYTYDFGSAFGMGINFQDGFLKEMKSPTQEMSQFLTKRVNGFRRYLYDAISVLKKSDIPMDVMEVEYTDIRERFLSLMEQNAFEPILEDISVLYPKAVVNYYRMLLQETACVLQDKINIKPPDLSLIEQMRKIADLLADSRVKEYCEYCGESTENVPSLAQVVEGMNYLIEKFPSKLKEKYNMELCSITNQLLDLKNGHYYERIQSRGIPRITTIGERLQAIIADLYVKIAEYRPGAYEEIRKYSGSINQDYILE